MEKGNQKRRGRRRRWKFTSGLLAGLLAFALMLGLAPSGSAYAADGDVVTADGLTLNDWPKASMSDDLNNVGHIWTDKSVSAENIGLSEGTELTVSKDSDADFLVGLSALSSTSNLTTTTEKPLDIVLVLDKSGSMADPLDYQETYNIQTGNSRPNYYVLVGGEYKELGHNNKGWYYTDKGYHYVTPKTSANDSNTNHVQFYVAEETKLAALKNAVNAFIDSTAAQNAGKEQESQHRIGIVSYAYGSNSSNNNKTVLNQQLTYVTDNNKDSVKGIVNSLYANGATYADDGMKLAQDELEHARDNVQKVVIFFTDGEPNHQSGFDGSVAASVVNTAYNLKQNNTLIYTIGVFQEAEPSADPAQSGTTNFNKYMHAVSSNYPSATATRYGYASWDNLELGTRNAKSGYYKAASNSNELNQVFEEIASEINTPGSSPTKVEEDASKSGYITFTDQLGDYMKVVGNTITVVYNGTSYSGIVGTNGDVTFDGNTSVPGNGVYDSADLSDLKVFITEDAVTVQIPATLIPLNMYEVQNGQIDSVEKASPIRIFYNVKLSDEARAALEDPESELGKSAVNGTVSFYSNAWTSGNGTTTAAFTPADSNAYYIGESGTDSESKAEDANKTFTAETVYTASWQGDKDEKVTYYLGNNGKLTVTVAGALRISKTTKADAGLKAPDKEFTFKLTLTDSSNNALTEEFNAVKKDSSGTESSLPVKNGSEITLKNGESLYIYGLPNGAKYSVEERNIPDGFTVQGGSNPVSGSIAAGKVASAAFTNQYSVEPVSLDGETYLIVSKTLNGRDWLDTDEFTFTISAKEPENAPTPEMETLTLNKNQRTGSFGDITFSTPGTYTYLITENQGTIAGVDYSKARYCVTVTVTDKQDGTLDISSKMEKIANDEGEAVTADNTVKSNTASFTNDYSADSITLTGETALKVKKTVTGAPNNENFSFTAVLDAKNSSENAAAHVSGLTDGKITAQITDDFRAEESRSVSFGDLTFDAAGTYVFNVEEDNATVPSGWTYDNTSHQVTVIVTDNTSTGKLEAKVMVDGGEGYIVSFTNEYQTDSYTVQASELKGSKTLEGRDSLENEKFTFTLEPNSDTQQAIKEEKLSVNGTLTAEVENLKDEVKKTFTFSGGSITINKAGTYTFEVKETIPVEADENHVYEGVTYDAHTGVITITATDNDFNGKFVIDVAYGTDNGNKDTPDFVNKYQAGGTVTPGTDDAVGEAKLTKVLKGREWGENETFSFTITADKEEWNTTLPKETTVTVNKPETGKEAEFNFGLFTFNKAGTYTYTVKENIPEDTKGLNYDNHGATVQIVVTDNLHGHYVASVSIENGEFTNSYGTSLDYNTAGGLTIEKTMENRAIEQGEFKFTIDPQDTASEELLGVGSGEVKTVVTPENSLDIQSGKAIVSIPVFNNVMFDQEDNGKTYTYIIKETAGDKSYYTYDSSEYKVTISVTDDGAGTLTAATTVSVKDQETGEYENSVTYTYDNKGTESDAAVVSFTNSYNAETVLGGDGNVSIQATKTLKNMELEANAFSFNIAYTDGTPVTDVDGNPITGTNDAEGTITFAPIEYNMEKLLADVKDQEAVKREDSDGRDTYTYTYNVLENTSSLPESIQAETPSFTIKVVITDDGEGGLIPEVIYPNGNSLEFVNTYGASASAVVEINGSKVLQTDPGTTPPEIAKQYTFTIEGSPAEDGTPAPMPERTTTTNDESNSVSFGEIEFTMENVFGNEQEEETENAEPAAPEDAEGTENGEAADGSSENGEEDITEAIPSEDEAALSPETDAPVNSEDNVEAGDEKADVEESAADDMKEAEEIADDTADNSGEDNVKGSENVSDSSKEQEKATVNVLNVDMLQTAPGQESDGKRSKTFTYTVKETAGHVEGVENDENQYTFTVTVIDNGDGTINVQCSTEGNMFTFTNVYSVEPETSTPTGDGNGLTITKKITGRDLVDKEFDFELVEAGTNEVAASGVNDANGNVELSPITFDKPGTYNYILREASGTLGGVDYDTNTYKVQAVVVDNGNGTMSVEWAYGDNPDSTLDAVFNNTYTAASTSVTLGAVKRISGRALTAGEFTFRLTDESGKVVSEAKNDANGAVSFAALTFDKAGTYKYTVSEVKGNAENVTYDSTVYTVTITVQDNNYGQLIATVSNGSGLVFTNTYTEPASSDNGSSSSGHSGSSSSGSNVQVISAQTGDDTNIVLPIVGICVSVAVIGICLAVVYSRKKKTE